MKTVRDLMQTDVVTVSPETSVRELTRILAESGVSGVPVVTDSGEVLGVVSSSDVVRLAAEEREGGIAVSGLGQWTPMSVATLSGEGEEYEGDDEQTQDMGAYFLPEDSPVLGPDWSRTPDAGPMDDLTVSDLMTPVTFSVPMSATLRELAEFLVRGRIHRAVVLDDGRLQGIVSTMDVLRAVAEGAS